MRKKIVIISCVLAGLLGSCSKMVKNDPWTPHHQKARNKVAFPVG